MVSVDRAAVPSEAPILKDDLVKLSFTITDKTFDPLFHFRSSSWINDPCGLFYNQDTGEYHFYFQFNPDSYEWGSMHWGLATSKDLIHFEYRGIAAAPLGFDGIKMGDKVFDENHVFTGMVVPNGVNGDLTAFYTSVDFKKGEKFGWKLPYLRDVNQERVAMAVSKDHGLTWSERQILIPTAPTNYDVIGWRDPFVFQDTELSAAFQLAGRAEVTEKTWFMVLGSGERNVGGRVPLYTSTDLLSWKYEEDPILAIPGQEEVSWRPSFGWNFETVSKVTLPSALDDGESKNVFLIGTEGFRENNPEGQAPMWTLGGFKPDSLKRSVSFERQVSGPLDHGQYYYAPGLLQDSKKERMVVSGWIKEDKFVASKQKWAGVLSVPRQISMTKIENVVVRGDPSDLVHRGFLVHDTLLGSHVKNVETLGIAPIPELLSISKEIASLPETKLEGESRVMTSAKTTSFQATAKFSIEPSTNPIVGLTLRATPDGSQKTEVLYDHGQKLIKVVRPDSPNAQSFTELGDFELLEQVGVDGVIRHEDLDLTVFVDNSVVEVFANGRFALSTRIYPTTGDANGVGVVGKELGSATLKEMSVRDYQRN